MNENQKPGLLCQKEAGNASEPRTSVNGEPYLPTPETFSDGTTLIIINNGKETRYAQRGVAALFDIVKHDASLLNGARVVDKAVGKAAAALLVQGKAAQVCTPRISEPALNLLETAGIKTCYGELVPRILNRAKNGYCPLETLCQASDDVPELIGIIDKFVNHKQ